MIHSTSQLRGRTSDGVVHGGECLSGEAAALPEGVPELAAVATVQEVDVGLADGDVGRRGVGVQLLVPLLQEVVLDALRRLTCTRQQLAMAQCRHPMLQHAGMQVIHVLAMVRREFLAHLSSSCC
jgi:hypothetical protein